VYEVAPYITKVNMGVVFSGGVAINKDTWAKLPPEVQQAMREAGAEYTRRHGEDLVTRHQTAIKLMVERGAGQNPPVTVTPCPRPTAEVDRADAQPGRRMGEEQRGARRAGQAAADQYMAAMRARGAKPERNWEQ
jgi:TRAP-type transport system periplasmic protein